MTKLPFLILIFFFFEPSYEGEVEICIPIIKSPASNFSTTQGLSDLSCLHNQSSLNFQSEHLFISNASSLEYSEETKSWFVKHLYIDFKHPAISINGSFDDIYITGLDTYKFCLLDHFNPVTSFLFPFTLFYLDVSKIALAGKYHFDGNIGDLFDIFGQGDFWMHLSNLDISSRNAKLKMVPKDKKLYVCLPMSINITIPDMENYFFGLMGDPELEVLFNKAFEIIIPLAVSTIWKETEWADHCVQEAIDYIINHLFPKEFSDIFSDMDTKGSLNEMTKKYPICYPKK